MKITEMNWPQVEEYLKSDDRAVVPLGCTEQHAFLSLSVDSILAERSRSNRRNRSAFRCFPFLPTASRPISWPIPARSR